MPTREKGHEATKQQAPASSGLKSPQTISTGPKTFYGSLFGWTFDKIPTAVADYWHIDTGGGDGTPDGGLLPRMHPRQPITNYISVPSVTDATAKVEALGGRICNSKTAVPQMGYFAICEDTEGNTFALWEMNERAK